MSIEKERKQFGHITPNKEFGELENEYRFYIISLFQQMHQ